MALLSWFSKIRASKKNSADTLFSRLDDAAHVFELMYLKVKTSSDVQIDICPRYGVPHYIPESHEYNVPHAFIYENVTNDVYTSFCNAYRDKNFHVRSYLNIIHQLQAENISAEIEHQKVVEKNPILFLEQGSYTYPDDYEVLDLLTYQRYDAKHLPDTLEKHKHHMATLVLVTWLAEHHKLHATLVTLQQQFYSLPLFNMKAGFEKYRYGEHFTSQAEIHIARETLQKYLLSIFLEVVNSKVLDESLPWEWQKTILVESFVEQLRKKEHLSEVYRHVVKNMIQSMEIVYHQMYSGSGNRPMFYRPEHILKIGFEQALKQKSTFR